VWWFGFDCGHSGDGKDFSIMDDHTREMYERHLQGFYDGPIRDTNYVAQHCSLLARQLWYIGQMVSQSALPAVKDESSQDRFNFEYLIDKSFEEI
jgi:hypothetical protein